MSWSGVIFNREGCPETLDEAPDDWRPSPLGPRERVSATLDAMLTPLTWQASDDVGASYATLQLDTSVIELSLPDDDPVEHLGVRIVGGGDALPLVVALCHRAGWVLYDAQEGELVELGGGLDAAWARYQAWLSRALAE